jgi:ParB-like chromosome segregation protein Spo0J
MSTVKHGFDLQIIEVPLDRIRPGSPLPAKTLGTAKYRTILSSIRELGVIEPLAVHPAKDCLGDFDLLDGRLRLEALKVLGRDTAPCMVSHDDEGFTFNRHINRITAVQEHRMIRASLAKGASEDRIAEVLKLDVRRIREKIHLLDGVAPEAVALLKDRQAIPKIFAALKKMKPMRQIEAVEMMIAANRLTATYAEMILLTTRPESLSAQAQPKKKDAISAEDIARMEAEMERLHQDCQAVEDGIGDTLLSLVVAKGFMNRLLKNDNIFGHLRMHHEDLLGSLVSTLDAISADTRTPLRE